MSARATPEGLESLRDQIIQAARRWVRYGADDKPLVDAVMALDRFERGIFTASRVATPVGLTDDDLRAFSRQLRAEMDDLDGAAWQAAQDLRDECRRAREHNDLTARIRVAAAINAHRSKETKDAMIDRTKPLTEQTMGDLRAWLDALHANRERYDRANRIVEARACELEIGEATRALAILNRRATEALDHQVVKQHEVDALFALLRHHDEPEAHALVARMWTAIQVQGAQPALTADAAADLKVMVLETYTGLHTVATRDRLILAIDRATTGATIGAEHQAGRALTADEVHAVVRETVVELWPKEWPTNKHTLLQRTRTIDAIAARVAEKLAGRAVAPAQREQDLREAFLAGIAHGDGWIDEHGREQTCGKDEDVAAEYARSKAGG